MLDSFDKQRLAQLAADEISDSLEQGSIVFFPESPVALPSADDLEFIRQELPALLKLKNISYHPEAGKVRGLDTTDAAVSERVTRILSRVSDDIAGFLKTAAPRLTDNWTVGTCSFRPIEERGRELSAHASNELVHIDAGAYGATNGDRILRFFINVNPGADRVWASKGNFTDLFRSHGDRAQLSALLDRPLRLCGVVRNTGEPGGGPFWVRDADGNVTKQIVEASQVAGSADQQAILGRATHFNPVDLVCALRDHRGRPFDLTRFVDHEAVIVTRKVEAGQEVRVLERPGLWNGAMAGWNTVFVEVPIETFTPVKTIGDLLRAEHLG